MPPSKLHQSLDHESQTVRAIVSPRPAAQMTMGRKGGNCVMVNVMSVMNEIMNEIMNEVTNEIMNEIINEMMNDKCD